MRTLYVIMYQPWAMVDFAVHGPAYVSAEKAQRVFGKLKKEDPGQFSNAYVDTIELDEEDV